tara:strand:- start:1627 stop:2781 length:1155 start_codon:yes stop_codon:yes gene_type:complete
MANDKDFKIKNGLQVGGAFVEKVGTVTGNASLDLSTGNVFDYTPTANATFTFSNVGASEHSFVLSVTGDEVAVGYDLANASYDSVSFSVAAQESQPNSISFKTDGTKMYIVGYAGDDVNEYDLSTAWDISTASYLQNFSVGTQEGFPYGLFFKPDGTKMYITGEAGNDVNEYNLSTAWDVSTASYVQNFSVSAQITGTTGVFFKPDGSVMYVIGFGNLDTVNQYSLSTAWDISTASYVQNFNVGTQENTPHGLFFKPDGLSMYVTGLSGDDINEYNLSAAWDISTATFLQNFSVAAQDTSPTEAFFKTDGSKMYVLGAATDKVYQYSTVAATTSPATLTFPASVKWPSGTAPAAPADGKTDILELSTMNGGTTWYGVKVGGAMA